MKFADDSNGQDSFLDIVANLVGVLIILVVIVGAQATTAWQSKPLDDNKLQEIANLESQAQKSLQESLNIQSRNAELRQRVAYQQRLNQNLSRNRHNMLMAIETVKKELAEQNKTKDSNQQAIEKIQTRIDFYQQQIEQVRFEFNAVNHVTTSEVETIDHFPTPIAKTVFADEIHFQLKDNRVAYVPMDELVSAMKSEWKVKAKKLAGGDQETWEIVGPISLFRLQYLLKSVSNPHDPSQYGIQFQRFVLQPTRSGIGERIEKALGNDSDFQKKLRRLVPSKTTITFWVFPDSYEGLFELREFLRKQGFITASWPLDFGQVISGGPNGFRTSTN